MSATTPPHQPFTAREDIDWDTVDASHVIPRAAVANHQANQWCWCGPESFFFRTEEHLPPQYVYVHRVRQ